MSNIFLYCSASELRQGLSVNLEFINLAKQADQSAPGFHLSPTFSPRAGITHATVPGFYVSPGDQNSGPLACNSTHFTN